MTDEQIKYMVDRFLGWRLPADFMPDAGISYVRSGPPAWERLKDFGWNDPVYCPKDGTEFDVIELGSTGIFSGRYEGTWPDGHWELMDDRDVYPTSRQPAMFKLRKVRVPAYADPNFKYDEATGKLSPDHSALPSNKCGG